ncbi:phage major capsid protein [Rhizobium leguminosarum]|uniref:HK97 family phage major capsid protein n=1 Tax=Rhizobium leguminosarum TaxID=384 RepID=A0A7W9ZZP5_RHILE|nr:phage major capsid protein [Rhizobium leguminosarum]MBB6224559.1 HK97 family phage major capsid protein [Rhizobium leguminosarum]
MSDKSAVEQVMSAFEEFKAANDNRLKEIEKKGAADVVLSEKVERINGALDKFEKDNQKATAELLETKKALDDEKKHVDELEEKLNRMSLVGANDNVRRAEVKSKANVWARAVFDASIIGQHSITADQQKALAAVTAEYKAMGIANDTTGGYLAPIEYIREIIKGVTDVSPARTLSRVRQTASKAITIPKRTGQFAAQWVADQGTKSETDGLRYGMWEIPTHEMYALIDISNQNLEDSAFNMEAEINFEATEQFAVAEGAAFVSGNGVGKPLGFLDASSGLSENVSGSAVTIADVDGQANGLLALKYALKTAYARNATWALNRTTLGSVRRLKDAQKGYIWMPGIAGQPNTIDGDPYVEVPDMPSEGAGAYPIAYGDFARAYTLVDRIQMEMLRDPYTQATSGNIRFIFRRRLGGQVTLAEAVRKLKCST